MPFLKSIRNFIPHWFVNYFYHFPLAFLAVIFYRYPAKNLVVVGVTGTDGKTTTATLIYEILRKAGKKVALITSVCAKIGKKTLDTGLHVTTPDSWWLQRLLKEIVDQGLRYLVLESTSHGLAQYRLLGCNFKVAVVTNVTHEHLDYHGTWENYLAAKAKLFQGVKFSILNKEDKSFPYLKKEVSGKIITYGFDKANFSPSSFAFKSKLPGGYNQLNCLAAIATAKVFAVPDKVIKQVVASFVGVRGRMDEVKNNKGFRIFIDFAHTSNGLENALKTLKEMKPKRLIAVFGCAGLRDCYKRPKMGEIACRLADKVILTAEDPRTEEVGKIIEKIASGCKDKRKLYKIADRQEAINFAIQKLAQKSDIIGVFGKGHERSMCFGEREYPWSEHEAVKKALKVNA